jgi:5-oxoprolinase (ATP-hydrolysing)
MGPHFRIGVDIGGTFTDLVLLDGFSSSLKCHKVLTTRDPAEGVLAGLRQLLENAGIAPDRVSLLVHGTTLVANALVEGKTARTGLLTTRGFRDVLEFGREQRYDIYDLFLKFPEPLVPRRLRLEVDERVSRDGVILRRPDPGATKQLVRMLLSQGVEAVAVCFLHAYLNPENEQTVARWAQEEAPDLAVSTSAEVAPEVGEYERTVTTVANACVRPLVDGYLGRLEAGLEALGFGGRFLLMQSTGGSMHTATARRLPIRLLESGPAGGALAAAFFGRLAGLPDLIAFDMGGTTAKVSLSRGGRPDLVGEMEIARVHRFRRGSGLPLKTATVDLIEVGAGGGSIARVDSLGLLKVGPQSAGALPGPVCYGRGGTEPTVTDACLVLGYYDPESFLGGRMRLDSAAAMRAVGNLAARLGLGLYETALGIYEIVCQEMASAARIHLIEKGVDPRRFTLLAFGGAGPAHACRVARRLGVRQVAIPPVSGVASALGFLLAPVSFEFSRSYPSELFRVDWNRIAELYAEMEASAREALAAAGVTAEDVRYERSVRMRLAGQFHDLEVPLPYGVIESGNPESLLEQFKADYRARYHAVPEGYQPLVVSWRLRALGPEPWLAACPGVMTGAVGDGFKGRRRAYFNGGFLEVPVFDRYRLKAGIEIPGPAIIEEPEATTVVWPGDRLAVDPDGMLRIRIGGLGDEGR